MSARVMKGLCTEVVPEHGTLHECIQFRKDLPTSALTAPLAPRDVVVHVRTAALAVDDIHGAEGTYLTINRTSPKSNVGHERPYIPGMECCGEVVRAGRKAIQTYPVGSQVICFQSTKSQYFGTWGEYFTFSPGKASVDDPFIIAKPPHLTDAQAVAAMVPLRVATCTLGNKQVYQAMNRVTTPQPPTNNEQAATKTALVIGAGGAVGSVLLQALRHEWPNARRIAICSGGKRARAFENGATHVVAYDELRTDWSLEPGIQGKCDVVLDLIGGTESLEHGRRALRRGGVFSTTVGPWKFIGDEGPEPAYAILGWLLPMVGGIMANVWRHSYQYYARDMSQHANKELYHRLLVEEKAIHPIVDSVIDIQAIGAVRESIQRVRRHETMGRMVLRVSRGGTGEEE